MIQEYQFNTGKLLNTQFVNIENFSISPVESPFSTHMVDYTKIQKLELDLKKLTETVDGLLHEMSNQIHNPNPIKRIETIDTSLGHILQIIGLYIKEVLQSITILEATLKEVSPQHELSTFGGIKRFMSHLSGLVYNSQSEISIMLNQTKAALDYLHSVGIWVYGINQISFEFRLQTTKQIGDLFEKYQRILLSLGKVQSKCEMLSEIGRFEFV